jgi:hypothetical protein
LKSPLGGTVSTWIRSAGSLTGLVPSRFRTRVKKLVPTVRVKAPSPVLKSRALKHWTCLPEGPMKISELNSSSASVSFSKNPRWISVMSLRLVIWLVDRNWA